MFITDTDLKARLASLLSIAPTTLATKWDVIVRDSNRSAYNEIVGVLLGRGFTLSQITSWARGAEFETDIGLFWCAIKGGGLEGYDDKFINRLDRRKELKEVDVVVAGVFIEPADSDIGTGDYDTTEDLFILDPDDVRRGEVTQF